MSAPFRFPRAIAFTVAMFSLAAGAHVLAGGSFPQPVITAGIVALVLMPVMMLSRTKINAPAMIGLLGFSQLILHGAFNALSVSAGFTSVAGAHVHGAPSATQSALGLMPVHAAVPGVLMLALHAAATLATALVLARGEAAVWALAAWLGPLIRVLAAVAIPAWPHVPAPPAVVICSRWRNLRLPALRGPPAFLAAH